MEYSEALAWLFDRRRMGMKYGLDRMTSLMNELGNPERSFDSVHIVGTNGKGSTAAVLSALAGELGMSWGRGTSPHLLDYRERIVVNDSRIPEEMVAEFITDNRDLLTRHSATFFEITTALAAWYFRRAGVRWVAAEAGLGGRLDATRTYKGKGTVFTGVRIEHSRILGSTSQVIAGEKVAIAEPGTILVAFRQPPEVEQVITRAIEENSLRRIHPVTLSMVVLPGAHQGANCSLAVTAALELFGYPEAEVMDAYARLHGRLRWPGRLDHRLGKPSILFDVAHNPQSMKALIDHISAWPKPVPAVIGFLADKPWKRMISMIKGIFDPVVVTTPDSERRLPAEELAAYMSSRGFHAVAVDPIAAAVERCRAVTVGGSMVVTGSFFVVGEAINSSVKAGLVSGVPRSAGDFID